MTPSQVIDLLARFEAMRLCRYAPDKDYELFLRRLTHEEQVLCGEWSDALAAAQSKTDQFYLNKALADRRGLQSR